MYVLISLAVGWIGVGMLEDEIDRVLNERYSKDELKKSGVENKFFVKKTSDDSLFSYPSNNPKKLKTTPVVPYERGSQSSLSKQTKNNLTKMTALGVVLLLVSVASAGVMVGFWMQNLSPRQTEVSKVGDGLFTGDDPEDGGKGVTPGTIPGSFTVDNFGQASYSMPIEVPPGTAGMQPSLSINYNSMTGNGLLGVGFSLGGLSVITRDACDFEPDGYLATRFSDEGRFALDGMRLVRANGAEYTYHSLMDYLTSSPTMQSVEFRKLIDDNTRVTVYGTSSTVGGQSGIVRFVVETSSGLVLTYGYTHIQTSVGTPISDGRINSYSFALTSVNDQYGNYAIYYYNRDDQCNMLYLSEIKYGGKVSPVVEPYNTITFIWEERDDHIIQWNNHVMVKQSLRLKEIQTFSGDSSVLSYDFVYQYGATQKSELISITLYDAEKDIFYPDTTFQWTEEFETEIVFDNDDWNWTGGDHKTYINFFQMDVNGDGQLELVDIYRDVEGTTGNKAKYAVYVKEENTYKRYLNGWADPNLGQMDPLTVNGGRHMFYSTEERRFIDFNREVVFLSTNPNDQMTKAYKSYVKYLTEIFKQERTQFFTIDFDGDGKTDLLKIFRDEDVNCKVEIWSANDELIFEKKESATQVLGPWTSQFGEVLGPIDRYLTLDANGNGKQDLARIYHENNQLKLDVWPSNGTSFEDPWQTQILNGGDSTYEILDEYYVFDVNKDGRDDFIRIRHQLNSDKPLIEVYLSTLYACPSGTITEYFDLCQYFQGESWGQPTNDQDFFVKWSSFHFTDVNGNGLIDIVQMGAEQYNSLNLQISTWLSNGNGYFNDQSILYDIDNYFNTFPPEMSFFCLDLDSDGLTDIINIQTDNDQKGQAFWAKGLGDGGFQDFTILCDDLGEIDIEQHWLIIDDMNFDGKLDFIKATPLYSQPGSSRITSLQFDTYLSDGDISNRIIQITNGLDVTIDVEYVPLPSDKGTYTGHFGDLPDFTRHFLPSLLVVSEVLTSTGTYSGDSEQYYKINYYYGGAKFHYNGLGFIGFKKIVTEEYYDENSVKIKRMIYDQMFPFYGLVKEYSFGTVENDEEYILIDGTNNYDYSFIDNSRYQLLNLGSEEKQYHYPEGNLLNSVVFSESEHNEFGIAEKRYTTIKDSFGQTISYSVIESSYENRVGQSQWIIGLPETIKITEAFNENLEGMRESNTLYSYNSKGYVYQITDEYDMPDNEELYLETFHYYDLFGNNIEIKSIHVSDGISHETIQFQAQYDSRGRFMLWQKNAKNHQITYNEWHDGFGLPLIVTDANGLTTTYEYDGFGRVKQIIDADGVKTKMFYNFNDGAMAATKYRVKTETTGQPVSRVYYDKFGRVTETLAEGINGQSIRTRSYYDMFGRVIQQSQPYFSGDTKYYMYYDYDILDRVTTITQPFSESAPYEYAITSYGYDGFTTTMTDPLGFESFTHKNALGQIVETENALNQITSFEYDSSGNMVKIIDPAGIEKSWVYDIRNRVKSHIDPNKGSEVFTYNALNQVVEKVDNKGQIFEMAYDNLGRMIRMDYAEGYNVWVYDEAEHGIGKLWKSQRFNNPTSLVSKTEMEYDELGRLSSQSKSFGGRTYDYSYSYDECSRLYSLTYPSGMQLVYGYDEFGYNTKISRVVGSVDPNTPHPGIVVPPARGVAPPGGGISVDDEVLDQSSSGVTRLKPVWELVEMSPFGSVAVERFGNRVVTTSDFNKASGFLEGIVSVHQNFADLFIQDIGYEYDFNGNVVERSVGFMNDAVWDYLVEGFSYDALNRLVSTSGTATAASIEYDLQTGNIYKKSDIGPESFGMYYYGGNQPNAVDEIKGHVTGSGFTTVLDFSYDGNGNMVSRNNVVSGEVLDITYNSFNLPMVLTKTVDGASSPTIVYYEYDESGNKVGRVEVNQGVLTQTRMVDRLYEEVSQGNSVEKRHFIYAGGRAVAVYVVEGSNSVTQGVTRYLHRDGLGSVEVITDDSGGVVERFSYDAWGKRRNVDGTVLDGLFDGEIIDRGFTGHRHVDSLGLIDMNARMYDPVIGMFLSVDPLGDGYRYANDNPLKFTDPTGLNPLGWLIGAILWLVKVIVKEFLKQDNVVNRDESNPWRELPYSPIIQQGPSNSGTSSGNNAQQGTGRSSDTITRLPSILPSQITIPNPITTPAPQSRGSDTGINTATSYNSGYSTSDYTRSEYQGTDDIAFIVNTPVVEIIDTRIHTSTRIMDHDQATDYLFPADDPYFALLNTIVMPKIVGPISYVPAVCSWIQYKIAYDTYTSYRNHEAKDGLVKKSGWNYGINPDGSTNYNHITGYSTLKCPTTGKIFNSYQFDNKGGMGPE
jgi:RHS repeat-associated protein